MQPQVAVIGSSNVDLMMKMPTLPNKGETVTGATFMQTFGGKGANQAVACARAGARTLFINAVGNDPYVDTMLENYRRDGIDCSLIERFDDVPSGHALCMIGEQGKNYLSVASGANYCLTPNLLRKRAELLQSIPIWVLQCEIPPESNRCLMEELKTPENRVIWNYAPAIEMESPPLASCDVLIVNEIEAAQLSGLSLNDPESASQLTEHFHHRGVKDVVITLGRDGLFYSGTEGQQFLENFDVKVVDTVGAGDTFCGVLACALAERRPWEESLLFASAAANLSVTQLGAQPSIPERSTVESFLSSHHIPI